VLRVGIVESKTVSLLCEFHPSCLKRDLQELS
jgi:hypothetical protein